VPAYIRPLFCRGVGPFRWVALSGDPEDIRKTDAKMKELFPDNKHLHRWLDMAEERIAFQGLPARICWMGLGERHIAGLAFNEMVKSGELKAPIVIGRDHLDSGSVASPNRETEAMRDGSDAVSDWPLLNALLNTASGATWVSLHHGGGVGMGYSQHSGVVIVCDGTAEAAEKHRARAVERPGHRRDAPCRCGLRHRRAARKDNGLNLPMLNGLIFPKLAMTDELIITQLRIAWTNCARHPRCGVDPVLHDARHEPRQRRRGAPRHRRRRTGLRRQHRLRQAGHQRIAQGRPGHLQLNLLRSHMPWAWASRCPSAWCA
jgi:hypothetical protein